MCCLIVLLAGIPAYAAAQPGKEIRFAKTGISVGEVMRTVQSQTDYAFAYNSAVFDTSRKISLERNYYTVEEAVQLIAGTGEHSYMIKDNFIIINYTPKPEPQVQAARPGVSAPSYPSGLADVSFGERPVVREEAQPEGGRTPEPIAVFEPVPVPAYSCYTYPDLYSEISYALPSTAVKVNLLYGLGTLTPNAALEFGLTEKSTLEIAGSWNQWNYRGTAASNRKFNHMIIRPEYRRWLCERFDGHFFGVHAFFSLYNISGYNVPLLFENNYRYEGSAFGAGITYGYHWALSRQWSVEFHAGVGVARLNYRRFGSNKCAALIDESAKTYFGPTRAGISLVYMIK